MKILHIAPFNTAGVPIEFVRAERSLGHDSRLVTFGKDRRGYEEDICLDLPFLDFWGTRAAKKLVSARSRLEVDNVIRIPENIPLQWRPNNSAEALLVKFREKIWEKKINRFIAQYDLLNFDIYQLDGGLDFYKDGRIIRGLKQRGKKVICCYTGSDLRTRGVMPEIDRISDLNVTLEFDHLDLHPRIHHVFFPFDPWRFKLREEPRGDKIKIGHAPTSRQAKGSHIIIPLIKDLEKEYPVQLVLIENLPYNEALRLKAQCHIFIDQIGDLGYGINSLEAMAMGIPTCSCLVSGFEQRYSDHPFIVVDQYNLREKIIQLIEDKELRKRKGLEGRRWVEKYHDSRAVVQEIHRLAAFIQNFGVLKMHI